MPVAAYNALIIVSPNKKMVGKKEPQGKSHNAPAEASQTERQVGKRIKKLREALGLNFEELAALTREYDPEGIAPVTLRRYEREDAAATLPGLRELRILCDALDTSADYLVRAQEPGELESYRQDQLNKLAEIVKFLAREDGIPFNSPRSPDREPVRQAKLSRARLHTKAKRN